MGGNFHEDWRGHTEIRGGGSDRQFGLVFAAIGAAVALWPLRAGGAVRWPALALAAVFLLAGLVRPSLLGPLNRVWMRVGLLLGRVVNPLVTAVLFFVVFVPAGYLFRLLGKDPLRLKWAPADGSYWIPRTTAGASRETLSKQF